MAGNALRASGGRTIVLKIGPVGCEARAVGGEMADSENVHL